MENSRVASGIIKFGWASLHGLVQLQLTLRAPVRILLAIITLASHSAQLIGELNVLKINFKSH